MKYKIVINRDNEDQWTNWSGTDRVIIEAIIDDLTAELGHDIRTSELDVIRTSEELIDYTDEFEIVIADFCEVMSRLYHFDGGQTWFSFEEIKDNLWLTDQTGIDEIEEDRFNGTEEDLLALLEEQDIWNRFYSDWVPTGIGSQYISCVREVSDGE